MADSDNTTGLPTVSPLADLLATCRDTLSYLDAQVVFHHSGEANQLREKLRTAVTRIAAPSTTKEPAMIADFEIPDTPAARRFEKSLMEAFRRAMPIKFLEGDHREAYRAYLADTGQKDPEGQQP